MWEGYGFYSEGGVRRGGTAGAQSSPPASHWSLEQVIHTGEGRYVVGNAMTELGGTPARHGHRKYKKKK